MWYFTWILGVLLACAFGIINILWLEAQESFDQQTKILDPLTKLPSRVEFLDALADRIEQNQSDATPFSVLLVSLDAFHHLSDSQDDTALNRMLMAAATILREETRPVVDTAARYDAATFAVILPGTETVAAEVIARRICQRASDDLSLTTDGSVVSVGVAEYPVHTSCGTDASIQDQIRSILQSSDQAVKQAQQTGQNRFCCAA